MVGFLEFRVADEGAAVFAPVLWLRKVSVYSCFVLRDESYC